MKVLMFGWEFPPHISGGLGTVCKSITMHLAKLGTQITFVMPCLEGDRPEFENFRILGANEVALVASYEQLYERLTPDTLRLLRVKSPLRPYDTAQSYRHYLQQLMARIKEHQRPATESQGRLAMHGGYGAGLLEEVKRYALIGSVLGLQEEFDLIHAHDWITFPAAVEAKSVSGRPLVCHIHATEFDRTGDHPNQEIYDIERYGLEQADRVIAVSHRTKEMLMARYGLPGDKIAVVHNAISKETQVCRQTIQKGFREKLVLFLGRVTIQKGPDYFVEAARLVLQRMGNVRFVMAGSGDMFPRLVERVAACRMSRYFHFTGFLHGRDVEQIMAMSDLYVMPSVSEPFGITPFEAMLYDVPTIVSKQSGIAEILHNAIKVDFWDTEQLAYHIMHLLSDEAYAHDLVARGAEELEHISWDVAAQKYQQVHREMVES